MNRTLLLAFLIPALLLPSTRLAAAPGSGQPQFDFYLLMDKCKATIGYLVLSDESLKIFEGTPIHHGCNRNSQNIACTLIPTDSSSMAEGSQVTYSVTLDSPPLLQFERPGDFVRIDTGTHTAVIISRFLSDKSVGSKVCWGLFATEFEMQALKGKK